MYVKHRIKCGWIKYRDLLGVLCDTKILMRLKRKFYRSLVRPTMIIYGSECWMVDKRIEQSMSFVEIRMFRWMSGLKIE